MRHRLLEELRGLLARADAGMNEPYSFRFSAISFGWNISDVQKNEKKKIGPSRRRCTRTPLQRVNGAESQ
jgi:hypothetical protein